MKLFVVLLLVAVVVYNVDASHKKHSVKSGDAEESESWPSPTVVNNFDVPEEFHHHDGDDHHHGGDHGHEEDSRHGHHNRRN